MPTPTTPAAVFRRVLEETEQRERLLDQLKPLRARKRALDAGVSATYTLSQEVVTAAVRAGVLEPQRHYSWGGDVYFVRELRRTDPDAPPEYTATRIKPIEVAD